MIIDILHAIGLIIVAIIYAIICGLVWSYRHWFIVMTIAGVGFFIWSIFLSYRINVTNEPLYAILAAGVLITWGGIKWDNWSRKDD